MVPAFRDGVITGIHDEASVQASSQAIRGSLSKRTTGFSDGEAEHARTG
jgi:hypothetical protein